MNTRTSPPRRRHQEVLDAAARVFHQKGYDSTSIQDIANEVGILKGSLYYYIDSKEDLLYEIIQQVHDEAFRNLGRAESIDADPLQKIRAFVIFHTMYNAENLVRMGVFFHDFRSLSDEHRQSIIEARGLYDKYLRNWISQGKKAGIICADVDSKLATFGIFGMMNWIYQWYDPEGDWGIEKIANGYADFVVAGLACDPATHRPGHRSGIAPLTSKQLIQAIEHEVRAASAGNDSAPAT